MKIKEKGKLERHGGAPLPSMSGPLIVQKRLKILVTNKAKNADM